MASTQGSDTNEGPRRTRRVDAERNRDAILAAARETFEAEGVLAPLDGIAVRAGVGNATLYRNFPTREDLLAAVMADSITEAVDEAERLSQTRDPGDALVEWLVSLTWRLRIWHDLPVCLAQAHADATSPVTAAADPLQVETARLLSAAQATGAARGDLAAEDLFELATTLSWGVDRYGDDEAAARRRVLLACAGLMG